MANKKEKLEKGQKNTFSYGFKYKDMDGDVFVWHKKLISVYDNENFLKDHYACDTLKKSIEKHKDATKEKDIIFGDDGNEEV